MPIPAAMSPHQAFEEKKCWICSQQKDQMLSATYVRFNFKSISCTTFQSTHSTISDVHDIAIECCKECALKYSSRSYWRRLIAFSLFPATMFTPGFWFVFRDKKIAHSSLMTLLLFLSIASVSLGVTYIFLQRHRKLLLLLKKCQRLDNSTQQKIMESSLPFSSVPFQSNIWTGSLDLPHGQYRFFKQKYGPYSTIMTKKDFQEFRKGYKPATTFDVLNP